MYRLFVAVPVPDHIKNSLLQLKINISGAKWIEKEQLHITLKFIGEVDGQLFCDIRKKLSEIRMDHFSLRFKGVDHFPPGNSRRGSPPKVLWAGVEDKVLLVKLKAGIEIALSECGIKRESRKFKSHITLARLKNPHLQSVINFLSANSTFRSGSFRVGEFRLYSSKLLPGGAVHNIEAIYPLD